MTVFLFCCIAHLKWTLWMNTVMKCYITMFIYQTQEVHGSLACLHLIPLLYCRSDSHCRTGLLFLLFWLFPLLYNIEIHSISFWIGLCDFKKSIHLAIPSTLPSTSLPPHHHHHTPIISNLITTTTIAFIELRNIPKVTGITITTPTTTPPSPPLPPPHTHHYSWAAC